MNNKGVRVKHHIKTQIPKIFVLKVRYIERIVCLRDREYHSECLAHISHDQRSPLCSLYQIFTTVTVFQMTQRRHSLKALIYGSSRFELYGQRG